MYRPLARLREYGTRSRAVYVLMLASFLAALVSAFLLPGQLGVVSFVAFVNFTAGLWIAQSVHTLGHTFESESAETVAELPIEQIPSLFEEISWERFVRIVAVTGFAAAVFIFTASEVLPPEISVVATGAIGSIALLAAMLGFLIAAASTLNHEGRPAAGTTTVDREPPPDEEGRPAGENR
ncbi:hypothetical protein [Halolamina litorea]|uniref:Uncharacterized protein n=1 Tax=Halolamina litorea TaxID=1515593 RepID=A0ABD6BSE7_9EURY|nr:hypothetical protein [Halolamina litorea]